MLAIYLHSGAYNKKTLLGRVIESGVSVLNVALCNKTCGAYSMNSYSHIDNGIVDSIEVLI
jgi:hypothetical protein